MLFIGPMARELGHAPPPLLGWVVALTAPGVLLAVDTADKRWRRGETSP